MAKTRRQESFYSSRVAERGQLGRERAVAAAEIEIRSPGRGPSSWITTAPIGGRDPGDRRS